MRQIKSTLFLVFLVFFLSGSYAQKILDAGQLTATSTAAYSIRQLKTTYSHIAITPPASVSGFTNSTTPIIRVRRSSDNGQLDIGYLASGELDTVTLKSFVGGTNGFVSVWYDQSGNSRDVAQTTVAMQPRIVNSGVVERSNGKPSIRFISGANYAASTVLTRTIGAATLFSGGIIGSAMAVLEASSSNSSAWGFGNGSDRWQIHANEGGGLKFDYGNSYQRTAFINSQNEGVLKNYAFIAPSGQGGQIWINGVLVSTGQTPSSACNGTVFEIGGISSFNNWNHNDHQSELILFNSALGTNDRTAVSDDQGAFFLGLYIWSGATSGSYSEATNWRGGAVPGSTDDIYVPVASTNGLIVSSAVQIKNVTVEAGAMITIGSGGNLQATGQVINGGSVTGDGTFTFNGTAAQYASGNDGVYENVTINNSAGVNIPVSATFNGVITFTAGTLNIGNATSNPVVYNTIRMNGTVSGNTAGRPIRGSNQTDLIFSGTAGMTLFFDATTTGTTNAFRNVTFNNSSSTITLGNSMAIVGGDVSIASDAIVNLQTYTMNRSASGGTLNISGLLKVGGTTGGVSGSNYPSNFTTHTIGGTVEYGASGAQTVANYTYTNLTISGSGDKTFSAALAIAQTLSIVSGRANLSNVTTHTASFLILGGTGQAASSYGGTSSSASVKNATYFANVTGVISISNALKTWTGNTSTNWSTGGNWSGGSAPTASEDIVIPSSPSNQPAVSSAVTCRSLTLSSGASLTITSSSLTVAGDFKNNGGTVSGAGTIAFSGTSRTISGQSTTFPNLTINNGAAISITGSHSCVNFAFATGGSASSFSHNGTASLTISGTAVIPNPSSNSITKEWFINAGSATIAGVTTIGSNSGSASRVARITITTGTLTLAGNLVFSSAAAANSVLNIGAGATVNLGGALTFTTVGTVTADATSNFNYNGTIAQTVNMNVNYGNLLLNNTHANGATLGSGISATNVKGDIVVGSGLFNTNNLAVVMANSKTLTVANGAMLDAGTTSIKSGTGNVVVTINGVFETANTNGFSGLSGAAISSDNTPAVLLGSGSTVEYTASSGGQSVTVAQNYNNLTFRNTSGTNTASGTVVVNGVLTTTAGGIVSMGNNQLLGGLTSVSHAGTLSTANTSSTPIPSGKTWAGTVIYSATGGGQTISSGTYGTLTQQNTSSGNSLSGDVTVTTLFNFATSGSGKLLLGSNTLTLSGSIGNMLSTRCFTANGLSNLVINGSGTLGTNLFLDQTTAGTTNCLNNLTYSRNSQTITLGNAVEIKGAVIPAAGTLATDDMLKLISNAGGDAGILAGSGTYISGSVTVERYIPSSGRRWRFLASPSVGATLADWKTDIHITGTGGATNGFDATASNQAGVYIYDESISGDLNQGWISATHITNPLTPGKGFRVFVRGDRTPGRLDGTITQQNAVTLKIAKPITTGNVNMQPTFANTGVLANDGWNLMGNPYPCAIDWNAFHDAGRNGSGPDYSGTDYTHLDAVVYVLDPGGASTSYASYNAFSGAVVGDLAGGIIPSGAAFWVKASAALPSMTMKEIYKTATPSGALFKGSGSNTQFSIKVLSDGKVGDETVIRYVGEATSGADAYDITKVYGNDINIASIGSDGSFLAANYKPFNGKSDTIQLSLGFSTGGSYLLKCSDVADLEIGEKFTVTLIDRYKHIITDLRSANEYTFTVDKDRPETFGNDRFTIVIAETSTAVALDETNTNTNEERLYIYPVKTSDKTTVFSKKKMGTNTGITITDISGKMVLSINNPDWDNHKLMIDLSSYQSGLYFITVTNQNQTQIFKCIKE